MSKVYAYWLSREFYGTCACTLPGQQLLMESIFTLLDTTRYVDSKSVTYIFMFIACVYRTSAHAGAVLPNLQKSSQFGSIHAGVQVHTGRLSQ